MTRRTNVRFTPEPGFEHNLTREASTLRMLDELAGQAADVALELVPVDTGALAATIEGSAGIDPDTGRGIGRVSAGDDNAYYAGLVELGGNEYLRPAVLRTVGNLDL